MNNKTIEENDYLTLEGIKKLIVSPYPNEKADIVNTSIEKYCLISNKMLYILQNNITYRIVESDNFIMNMASLLIELSFKALNEKDKKIIELEHSKDYRKIFKNNEIYTYFMQLKFRLQKDNIIFDNTPNEIHFNNGVYDLALGKLVNRNIKIHFITHYIKRNYITSTKNEQKTVLKSISKIYNNNEDLKCVTFILESALSGKTTKDQEIIFLLGKGNSGKSTTLKITLLSLQCYAKELQSNTFSCGNTKVDKIMNTYANSPQIRISWVNEMEEKKIDSALFKKFCEGKLQTTMLYQENQHEIEHYSKLIITSNNMPMVKVDSGMCKRMRSCTQNSSFVKTMEEVNEKKNIYLDDDNFLESVNNDKMLNAWFDILAADCKDYINGKRNQFSDNFIQTKEDVMSGNDYFQDFIDSTLIITNNEKDRIGKESMRKLFSSMYPDKHMSILQIISALKDKNIVYNCKYRKNNIQGCFVGVKYKDDEYDEIDNDVMEQSSIAKLLKEVTSLKKQFQQLRDMQLKVNCDKIVDTGYCCDTMSNEQAKEDNPLYNQNIIANLMKKKNNKSNKYGDDKNETKAENPIDLIITELLT